MGSDIHWVSIDFAGTSEGEKDGRGHLMYGVGIVYDFGRRSLIIFIGGRDERQSIPSTGTEVPMEGDLELPPTQPSAPSGRSSSNLMQIASTRCARENGSVGPITAIFKNDDRVDQNDVSIDERNPGLWKERKGWNRGSGGATLSLHLSSLLFCCLAAIPQPNIHVNDIFPFFFSTKIHRVLRYKYPLCV
ncbi:hypothetical protein D9756_006909 [Leucocoprinus leucothites]|uniref:Uncharacterized protein n=1 Tax=Leucocoprinus leucothites TaxID=201217 RepID=A0A8H5D7N7_9AGAR|nr:hypothetical protein D9756_006909 [Leucoagaricus leucothites]